MSRATAPRPIVIDCDPGHDDALALLLALGSPAELELLAVTAVAGNAPLALTEKNARKVLELAGRPDIPVYAGCARPLVRAPVIAEYVHGASGLDGYQLPEPSAPLARGHAVDALIELLGSRPAGTITLCPIGPLTNVAMAMVKAPEIVPRIREIVLMGGAIGLGNVTPAAEANIFGDPQAADVVFRAGVPIVMCGLEVTHQALVTPARLAAIRALGTPVGAAVTGLLEFYNTYPQTERGRIGAPLHDPCVIAYLLRPELFFGLDCQVEVETGSELTMGRTVVDWQGRGRLNRGASAANAKVLSELDADRFFALLTERLARLPLP
jgi:inosine-uridine nucleoside N-ribohydrolase